MVNSGTEAIEGAIKLARKATGRSQVIAAHNAYHGNTMGSLSLMDFEERKRVFRPLLPDVSHITFNHEPHLKHITTKTACVVLETIQGGAGFIEPKNNFLTKVKAIDFKALFKLKRFIKQNKINLVHAHSTSVFTAVLVKLLGAKIKIVWHDHYGKSDFLKVKHPNKPLLYGILNILRGCYF